MLNVKDNVLFYISGFIVRKIILKIECKSYITALLRKSIDHDYCSSDIHLRFINFKNCSSLILSSDSVIKVIVEAEKILLLYTDYLKDLNISNLERKIILSCNNLLALNNIFSDLIYENISLLDRPHKMALIQTIIKKIFECTFTYIWKNVFY